MKTTSALLACLCALGLLSGCATVSAPTQVSQERKSLPVQPLRKVLLVFQVMLEYDTIRPPLGYVYERVAETDPVLAERAQRLRYRLQHLNRLYRPLADAVVAEAALLGVSVTYEIEHERRAHRVLPAGYSHAWVHHLEKLGYSPNKYGNVDRTWTAVVLQAPLAPERTLLESLRTKYVSDGATCGFRNDTTEREACVRPHAKLIAQQLVRYREGM
jgi:hypothetical protein